MQLQPTTLPDTQCIPSLVDDEHMGYEGEATLHTLTGELLIGFTVLKWKNFNLDIQAGMFYLLNLNVEKKTTKIYYNTPSVEQADSYYPSSNYLHIQYGLKLSYLVKDKFRFFIEGRLHHGNMAIAEWNGNSSVKGKMYKLISPIGISYCFEKED